MVRPGFVLSDANVGEVTEICRRLDGLPLALELAAARMRLFTPKALLARLNAGLDVAAGGHSRPDRHHTLRDAISWSYRLLDPEHQKLFRSLAVFAGGADLDTLEAVCGEDAVEELAALVDASLVVVAETPEGDPRIDMLVTIRSYALEEAEAEGELGQLSKRHLLHLLDGAGP